ncbi:hypothetical protein B0A48_07820 [Cryoendolithus antarcticus]|uniref:BTB domain-containing protein n=1 Tax=Cryoendolithus antarcticus TaxID=1507870 RepID=A0A1V8T7B7_9PEZI|nr:hypothetical protein B0A48_07820 [Cryoendolithus antarcticus]
MAGTSISPPSAGGNASITGLWNTPEYSDITIKFGGERFFCHKLVLCRASEYFKTQCGPGSRFAEANAKEVELVDDDPAALEAFLLHLYQHDYDPERSKSWQFYLALDTVADKYLLSELRDEAF